MHTYIHTYLHSKLCFVTLCQSTSTLANWYQKVVPDNSCDHTNIHYQAQAVKAAHKSLAVTAKLFQSY